MHTQAHHYFPAPRRARFCNQCGARVARRIPKGDQQERDICDECGAVHYQNPRIVVGTLPVWQGRILLCRRAIEPRYGSWTLPAGFMELGETTLQGAIRETVEESGAQIQLGELFTIINVPTIDQLHLYYLASAQEATLAPGPESLEARYYDVQDIPWNDLSFLTITTTLKHYLDDRHHTPSVPHCYTLSHH
jgi:ADP-ribose pyrophosphatase YjhB (NUDIX family)